MEWKGVHHVSINVDDVGRAESFYVGVLRMAKLARPDFGFPGLWLDCGGQQIHLIQVEDHIAPKGQHFALHVRDIESSQKQLRESGIEVSDILDIPGAGRQVFLHDPAGNMIELNQPGRDR